jgi:murein DD-endopeptidase MepM/ murein hydrolase activator NlpD
MEDCTIAAGFKNEKYRKAYGYTHYGVDFDSKRAVDFEVLASGKGTVVGVEMNKNSIGGVIVIRYDNVYCPKDKKIRSLIIRKYHCYKILVKKGDIIGESSNNGIMMYDEELFFGMMLDGIFINPFTLINEQRSSLDNDTTDAPSFFTENK